MTSQDLATLSTFFWLVGTVALFILLAQWSGGGTWGITSAIVQGIRGWSDSDGHHRSGRSPSSEALRPMLDPYVFLRRDAGPSPQPTAPSTIVDVEIVELWERPVARH